MWNGIMKVLEIQHKDEFGNVLWEQKGIKNLLHIKGEEFILRAAFAGGKVSDVIPENYYLGMDNRAIVDEADIMASLIGEPAFAGYDRQAIASSGDFTVALNNSHYQAISPIVTFNAVDAAWGPVRNLFLSNADDTLGTLISTAVLDTPVIVESGQSVTLRIAMTLKDCP